MRQVLLFLGWITVASGAWAQGPLLRPPANPSAAKAPNNPPPVPETRVQSEPLLATSHQLMKFDAAKLRLKSERGLWQLWAGDSLIRDFGAAQGEAADTLRLFREMGVNAHGSIGGTFEYWLKDGEAPSGTGRLRQVINFEPSGLRVDRNNDNWVLRDNRMVLYDFGQSQSDAEEALAVCRKYGFNQMGFVGSPTPYIRYLTRDAARRIPEFNSSTVMQTVAKIPANSPPSSMIVQAGGSSGVERESFDLRKLEVRRDGNEWVLASGPKTLGRFGYAEREARNVAQTLTQFRCNEIRRFGEVGIFLTQGKPPQGPIVGLPSKAFKLENLAVKSINGIWTISEGNRVLIEIGAKQDADRMLASIQEFKFDTLCTIGNGRLGKTYLFVRTMQ